MRGRAGPAGRSAHRRAVIPSLALMSKISVFRRYRSDSETHEMQAKCRTKHSYPSAGHGSGAMGASAAKATSSGSKPRWASSRAVLGPAPRRETMRSARSRSGAREATASSISSAETPWRSSSKRIAASPRPRSASASARLAANRAAACRPRFRSAPRVDCVAVEAEVRAGLLDCLPLQRRVEHRPLPRNPGAVDDVELSLLEGRRDLVLDHLHAHAVPEALDAVLERLDPPDVEPYR